MCIILQTDRQCGLMKSGTVLQTLNFSQVCHSTEQKHDFFSLGGKKISSMTGVTHHVCFTYIFACVHEPPDMLSPAAKMKSAVRIRLVCGASAQSMPPAEPREPSAKVRVTAGLTSAVPSNQVSQAVTLVQKTRLSLTPLPCTELEKRRLRRK